MSQQTPSLEELERQAELSRAGFTQTVDRLRSEISETSRAVQTAVSPQTIKANAKRYVRDTSQEWVDRAKDEFQTNPLRAIAIGSLLAYPVIKLTRAVPLPLALIGAGLLITGRSKPRAVYSADDFSAPPAGVNVAREAASVADQAKTFVQGTMADVRRQATERLNAATESASDHLDQFKRQGNESLSSAKDAAADLADQASRLGHQATATVRDATADAYRRGAASAQAAASTMRDAAEGALASGRASAEATASKIRETAESAMLAGKASVNAAADRLSATAAAATDRASAAAGATADFAKTSYDKTPLLVGGLALAVGAVIAAALPATDVERGMASGASEALKRNTEKGMDRAFRTAKDVVGGVAADMVQKAGAVAGSMADDASEKVVAVAEKAVTTAFELPSDGKTSEH